jgi:hypothetical protein
MTTLLVQSSDGTLYRVPDTVDVVPRDYDYALSLPSDAQAAILRGEGRAWPAQMDPKCIVVVRARGPPPVGDAVRCACTFWFVRLSHTPQILRRVPPDVRDRLRASLAQHTLFERSTLITDYMDTCVEFQPEAQAWERADPLVGEACCDKEESAGGGVNGHGSATRCVVCCARPARRVFIPCGHAVVCGECGSARSWSKCPICRSAVQHVNLVYV